MSKKSIFLAHRNLAKKKGLLAESISEIHHNTLESATHSNNILDGKIFGSESSHNIDVEECDYESSTENLCNNIDVALDIGHKAIEDTISSHTYERSLKNDDSAVNYDSLVNTLLKTSSDNDEACNIDHDSNLSEDRLTSLSLDRVESNDSSNSQSTPSASYSDVINDVKISLNTLDNNKNSSENTIDGNASLDLSEHVCKEMSMSQDVVCASCYDELASTSKTFKLPILEKMPKTASVQQPEIEENAVALLDSSFIKQNQLEGVHCLDLEPRSSNSSEESNSDIESHHASTSNNDNKKVNKSYVLSLSQKNDRFHCY